MILLQFSPAPLTRIREPFDSDEFLFELKMDGFRALASGKQREAASLNLIGTVAVQALCQLAAMFACVFEKCVAGFRRCCSGFFCRSPEAIIILLGYFTASESQVADGCRMSGHTVPVEVEQAILFFAMQGTIDFIISLKGIIILWVWITTPRKRLVSLQRTFQTTPGIFRSPELT